MILERTDKEILVRLPSSVDLTELQDMIDYLRYKELTSKSKAKQLFIFFIFYFVAILDTYT